MSITSFSKPSDTDVLRKIAQKEELIGFIGKGCIRQNVNETLYIRTVKIRFGKEEIFKNVIFIKKGIVWLFKAVEETTELIKSPC